jgi:putative transposase
MSNYRRDRVLGGTYFFTLVTFEREPFLTNSTSRKILRDVWKNVQKDHPSGVDSICLLPDHLHCLWTLPEDDSDYGNRWRAIKGLFTKEYQKLGGKKGSRNTARIKRGEAAIWQRRFWEHVNRDEKDYNNHFDYIHYNPVKHGLVKTVKEWPWSR